MRSVNKVFLIGNLTRDPELRETQSGQPVCTFGIATNREWMTQGGIKHSSTEFHELVAWARLAEICSQYLKKGKLIYVEGYLKTRSWDTPEGVRKFKTEIIIQDMIMLEKRPKGEEAEEVVQESEDPADKDLEKIEEAEEKKEEETEKEEEIKTEKAKKEKRGKKTEKSEKKPKDTDVKIEEELEL